MVTCAVCAGSDLIGITEYANFHRVTSDVRPWPGHGQLVICRQCGVIQKPASASWLEEIDQVYKQYDIYHQSGGEEQLIFDAQSGIGHKRSTLLMKFLSEFIDAKQSVQSILDIGCANGEFLSIIASAFPHAQLFGLDLDQRYEEKLLRIPKFQTLFHKEKKPNCQFDLISLIHTLEHIVDPLHLLLEIKTWLAPGGRLVVHVPNICENPFDLLVVDHRLHLSLTGLITLLNVTGFEVVVHSTHAVKKELLVIAQAGCELHHSLASTQFDREMCTIENHLNYLHGIVDDMHRLVAMGPIGIFGTSISSVWAFSYVQEQLAYFVDEDLHRVGRCLFGKSILAPQDCLDEIPVYIPLIQNVANDIAMRCSTHTCRFIAPGSRTRSEIYALN